MIHGISSLLDFLQLVRVGI